MTPASQSRRGYIAFLVLLGLAGWSVLIGAANAPALAPDHLGEAGFLSFVLFLVAIVAARAMAFELLPQSVVSLDSAFYVAATVCLGSITAGLLVGLALTLDTLYRLLRLGRVQTPLRDHSWSESLAYVLYFGGMTGALLAAAAWLFSVDSSTVHGDQVQVMRTVFGVGAVFLIVHYGIQGARQWMLGRPLRAYLAGIAVRGALAEVALLPLAAVVVFLYDPERPLGFLLLATTFLLVNYIFNRLSRARSQLSKRVGELETLNAISHRLAASLQIHALVDAVARETVDAFAEAESLVLLHRLPGVESDAFAMEVYDRDSDLFERLTVHGSDGITGHIMETKESILIADLQESERGADLAEIGLRAWMGVPIKLYGNVEGVLAVQSSEPNVFNDADLRLLEAISGQVAVALQNAHLYELAMVDGLTKLFVRRYFDARLDEEVRRSQRFGTVFSVAMMDIDNFKSLNDTYGHQLGDRALRAIAEVVRSEMRGVDTAARYGGEEIALILPRTDMVSAYNLAERIRSLIDQLRFEQGEQTVRVTASFGIAAYPESGAADAEELVRLADRALYRAKKTGKNRVELYWGSGQEGESGASVRSLE